VSLAVGRTPSEPVFRAGQGRRKVASPSKISSCSRQDGTKPYGHEPAIFFIEETVHHPKMITVNISFVMPMFLVSN
jgi:hypothetical protein